MESIAIDVFHQHPDAWFVFMSLTATRPTSTGASWPPQLFAIIIFLHHSANKQRSATSCTSFADRILYLNDLTFAFEPRWGRSICTVQWNTYQNQINYKSKEPKCSIRQVKTPPFSPFQQSSLCLCVCVYNLCDIIYVMHSTPNLFVWQNRLSYTISLPLPPFLALWHN